LGATQFQPSGARYCFPNFDEPGLKAVFDLKITHDASFKAIANTMETEKLK
jgi:aminopeptidase N